MKKTTIAIICLCLLFIAYALFESGKLIIGASLTVTSPSKYMRTDDAAVSVTGVVKRASYITLNDRQIFSDLDGNISEKLPLSEGYNIITVRVRGRFGEERTERLYVFRTRSEKPDVFLFEEPIQEQMEDDVHASTSPATLDMEENSEPLLDNTR